MVQRWENFVYRAPWIAESYYNDERTVEGFRDGWLYTGDVVTVDEEGCVKIVDRTKDVIKSGENGFPQWTLKML